MPMAVVNFSYCTGHPPFPPRTNMTSSPKFFVQGLGAVTVGDTWMIHCSGSTCHIGTQITGSTKMFIQGRPIARVGDSISCGSKNMTGSPKMFVLL